MSNEWTAGLAEAHVAEHSSSAAVVVTGPAGVLRGWGREEMRPAKRPMAGNEPALDERITPGLSQRNTAGRMYLMPKPVIAMLPGPAAGAGLAIALAADLRTMADTAFITTAFARVGFSGDYGGTYFLSHLVGSAKAREMYYLSDRVGAEECRQLGIANYVFPAAEREEQTLAVARRLGTASHRRYNEGN